MTRGVPDTTARYDRSVYVAKLQSDGEPAYEPAMNRIRPSRVLVLLLRTHTRRKTLLTALQVLQVTPSNPPLPRPTTSLVDVSRARRGARDLPYRRKTLQSALQVLQVTYTYT
jgi:hypothetical protein